MREVLARLGEELRQYVLAAALTRYGMRSGADIIFPACGMGNGSPLANVRAMLRTVRATGEEHASHPVV